MHDSLQLLSFLPCQVENPASNPDSTMDEAAEESPSPAEEDDETDDGEEETSGIKVKTRTIPFHPQFQILVACFLKL